MSDKEIKRQHEKVPENVKDNPHIKLADIPLGSHRVAGTCDTGSRVVSKDGYGTVYMLTEFKDGTTKWTECPKEATEFKVYVITSIGTILTRHV